MSSISNVVKLSHIHNAAQVIAGDGSYTGNIVILSQTTFSYNSPRTFSALTELQQYDEGPTYGRSYAGVVCSGRG